MTLQLIKEKIRELEGWLEHNHDHPNRVTVTEDLRKLKDELLKTTADAPGAN